MKIIADLKGYNVNYIESIADELRAGKVVVVPTETSYGMAVDATNARAVKRLYNIKGRDFNKPIHVLVSSHAQAKQLVQWNKKVDALAKKFWPGPLTIVSKVKRVSRGPLDTLTAGTGFLGVRASSRKLALNITRALARPITATSANMAGMPDCYSIQEVVKQFKGKRYKPDILIDAGVLPRRKPSTLVKVNGDSIEILREGPISRKDILRIV